MTDIYVVKEHELKTKTDSESPAVSAILAAILIICLPIAFWMGIIEFANNALALGLTMTVRLVIASVLAGLLFLVWCFVVVSARQMRNQETPDNLATWPTRPAPATNHRMKA
jgi:hypothetical protein